MTDRRDNKTTKHDVYQIYITPQMMKAGVSAYLRWEPKNDEIENLVAAVFYEMIAAKVTPAQIE